MTTLKSEDLAPLVLTLACSPELGRPLGGANLYRHLQEGLREQENPTFQGASHLGTLGKPLKENFR